MWQQIAWINNLVQDTATAARTCGWIKRNQKLLITNANTTLPSIIKCRLSRKHDTGVSSNAGSAGNTTLWSIIKCRLSRKHDTVEYHQMQAQQET